MQSVTNLFRCQLSYFLDTGTLIIVLTEKQKLIKYLKRSKCLGYKEKILTICDISRKRHYIAYMYHTQQMCRVYLFYAEMSFGVLGPVKHL